MMQLTGFKVTGTYLRGLEACQKMADKTWSATSDMLQRIAVTSADILRTQAVAPGLTSASLRKRQIGKRASADGTWPSIPAYSGTSPLTRSGALRDAVDWQRVSMLECRVGIATGVMGEFSGGKPILLSDLAAKLEETHIVAVPVTDRMSIYLAALVLGHGHPDIGHMAARIRSRKKTITSKVAGRNWFANTWDFLNTGNPTMFDVARYHWWKALKQDAGFDWWVGD